MLERKFVLYVINADQVKVIFCHQKEKKIYEPDENS